MYQGSLLAWLNRVGSVGYEVHHGSLMSVEESLQVKGHDVKTASHIAS